MANLRSLVAFLCGIPSAGISHAKFRILSMNPSDTIAMFLKIPYRI
jgi:hypothetical protein